MDAGGLIGVAVGVLVAWLLVLAVLWVLRPRDVRVGELVRVVPDVARLVRALLADRSVPLSIRLLLIGLLAWLLSPIDLIPEFVPILGPIDDVIVATLVLRHVRRRLGSDELRRRWQGSAEGFDLLSSILG